jgi:hypothetical protein
MNADEIADLQETIMAIDGFALMEADLSPKHRAILRRILRVRPAARAILPEQYDIPAIRETLHRLYAMAMTERAR